MAREVDVLVIGAGQAGLSSAYHLQRLGIEYAIVDAEPGPGGAWRHRWPTLTMSTVNGIYDLPGLPKPEIDVTEPAREFLPRYFGEFEHEYAPHVLRPVHVRGVRREDDDPRGRLVVETDGETWRARTVINATGTWTKPFVPFVPGQDEFLGLQMHTQQYRGNAPFANKRVAIVGGGVSAIQLMEEIADVGTTMWFTRREPVWREGPFTPEFGREAVAKVAQRVESGLPPGSVVSVTGLAWNAQTLRMKDKGLLERHPMFTRLVPEGVVHDDGSFEPVQAVLWATGFRASLDHLAPLHLRGHGGGVLMHGTHPADEVRLHLIGYGPSASTIGANRAGGEAARQIRDILSP